MPYFTGLARVARTTGFPVVETPGWKTNGHRAMSGCQAIIIHHTATVNTTANAPTLNYVRNNKLSHFVLGRDGTIYVTGAGFQGHAGKDSLVRPAHARNATSIGIEAENNGRGEKWPDIQMESYVRLVRALIDEFNLPVSRVYGHKEIAYTESGRLGRKTDPTFNMDTFRAAIQRGHWSNINPAGNTTNGSTITPKEGLSMSDIKKIEDALASLPGRVLQQEITVQRSGKPRAITVQSALQNLDSGLNAAYGTGLSNAGKIAGLESTVEQLASGTGVTIDYTKVQEAAKKGTEEAIAAGIEVEGTVELKQKGN